MNEFEVVSPPANEELRDAMKTRKVAAALRFGLMIACIIIALACFSRAEGAYNYNVTIKDSNKTIPIGEDIAIDAYVAYNGLPVKELPCIITFYDAMDNRTLMSGREYTDELGQMHYSTRMNDLFMYNNNYSYSVACANTTKFGSVFASVATTPNWFMNLFVYSNKNTGWMTILFIFGSLLVLIALLYGRTVIDR